VRAKVQRACEATGRTLRFSTMTGCLIGETRADALDRARTLYGRVPRDAGFEEWLAGYERRSLIGSVDEVAARLREYEAAGCERVMLQHLLHTDLDPVRLIGLLGQQLV
jgi:alkanesulfonate monooxygenase SsuD/methylene tetrahydromethanopterin reductase-like flavin-dependent oxidoreductase (luciferase family)